MTARTPDAFHELVEMLKGEPGRQRHLIIRVLLLFEPSTLWDSLWEEWSQTMSQALGDLLQAHGQACQDNTHLDRSMLTLNRESEMPADSAFAQSLLPFLHFKDLDVRRAATRYFDARPQITIKSHIICFLRRGLVREDRPFQRGDQHGTHTLERRRIGRLD